MKDKNGNYITVKTRKKNIITLTVQERRFSHTLKNYIDIENSTIAQIVYLVDKSKEKRLVENIELGNTLISKITKGKSSIEGHEQGKRIYHILTSFYSCIPLNLNTN